MASWTLPPQWHSKVSSSQNKPYYWHELRPDLPQWNEPTWDSTIDDVYSRSDASESLYVYRSLQNYIKSCFLTCFLKCKAGEYVLDLGCGKGGDVLKLPREVTYTGIDLCRASIATAQLRHPSKLFLQATFHNLDVLNSTLFDKMFSMFAFHYAGHDLVGALHNVRKHLKLGGLFLFTTLDDAVYEKGAVHPLLITKKEEKLLPNNKRLRRVYVQMHGTLPQPLPEYILEKDAIEDAAKQTNFKVQYHATFGNAMTFLGYNQFGKTETRDAVHHIRDTFYKRDALFWTDETWSFANCYKVVILEAC